MKREKWKEEEEGCRTSLRVRRELLRSADREAGVRGVVLKTSRRMLKLLIVATR